MASVKCPKCGNLINGVQAGQLITCSKCGNTMKLTPSAGTQEKYSAGNSTNAQGTNRGGSTGVKVIGILLVILGVIGILMGLMMFGDIGIACVIGALSALLSGIGFILASRKL